MDYNEFQSDVRIDLSSLDTEVLRQADTYFKWAKRTSEAKAHADRLEMVMEVEEARLQAAVRADPDGYQVEQGARGGVTEAAIKAAVLKHATYVKARDLYLDAKEEAAIIGKSEQAMDQKKRMLELLVTLHGQGYFADPRIRKELMGNVKDKLDRDRGTVQDFQKSKLRKVKTK